MRHFQLFLLFLTISFSGVSQLEIDFSCGAYDYKTNKKEAGVTVRIYDGSTVVASGVTGSGGTVLLKAPTEKSYKVEFSKSGKVTRFVTVNSKNIDIELLQGAAVPNVRVDMSMLDELPNVDYSYIKQNAVTDFYFDGKNPKLAYNAASADKMSKEVEKAAAAADKNGANNEVQFQAKMKEGEALATQKKYAEAATKFEQALQFKPTDKVAIKRLDDMDKLVKADKVSQLDGQAANAEFDNLVKAAELLKSQKKYQEAIDKYEEALTKKKDQGAEDEIEELMSIISKEKKAKENEAAYTNAMAAAEGLFKQKSYKAVKEQYVIALKAKPADPIATKKMSEVDVLLAAQQGEAEKKKNYEAAIAAADELFKAEQWKEAKVKYNEALALQSSSTYIQGQLTAIKTKLDEIEKEKAKQEQITKLITEGTTAMNADQLEPAKVKFDEVIKLDAANATATEKLKIINAKLEEQKQNAAKEASFKKLVDEGDAFGKTTKYAEAIAKYEEAIKIKADAGVDKKIADAKVEVEKLKNQKETKEKYDLAVKEGEALLAANKLVEAKEKFTVAQGLDDKAPLPKEKIKLIDDKIAAETSTKQKAEQYAAAMASGEQLLSAGKLTEARAEFVKAKEIDKVQTAPDAKIKTIDEQLKAEAATKDKADKYAAAMKAGDDFHAAGKLAEARSEYVRAKGVDGTQTAPDDKIKAIDQEMTEQASAKSAKEKADKYAAAMKAGDDLRAAGKFPEAKVEYVKAKGIDGTQTAPDEKIKAMETEAADQANAKAAKDKADKFAAAMKAGDDFRAAGKFTEAKTEYGKAKVIDGTQTTPDERIKEVETEIANLASAKEAKDKADKYNAAMKAGDDLRAAGKFPEAKAEYVKAKGIDGTQTAPDEKIKAMETEVADQANAKAAKEAQEKTDKYNAAMKAGDDLRAASKFAEAKAEYVKAKGIDGTQTAPDEKIKAMETEMADQANAKSAKEKADKYNAAMKAGDDFRAAGKFAEAKAEYGKAKGIDGTQTAPDDRIKEVDTEMANLASSKEAKDKADKYNAAMKTGDNLRSTGKLAEARAEYVKAKGIDGTQTAPDEKIKDIDTELGDLAASLEKKKQIDALLGEGASLLAKQEHGNAKAKYQAVLNIDPANSEATKKITEIENKINEQKNQAQRDEEFANLKKKGMDLLAQEKLSEARQTLTDAKSIKADAEIDAKIKEIDTKIANQGIEEAYASLMKEAADQEAANNYDGAIQKYKEASGKKPAEKAPKDKINALQTLKQSNEALAETDKKYKAAMQKGNDAFIAEDYMTAVKFFTEASTIKPTEKEPIERLDEAKNIEFKKNYEKILNAGQKAVDEKNWDKAIDLYNRAIGIKKDDPLPKQRLAEVEGYKRADAESKNALAETDKSYNAKVAEAEAAAKLREYDKAIALFNDAKKLKPQETTPDSRIADLMKEKSNAENAQKNEQLYLTAIQNGEAAVKNKQYDQAIAEYKNALNLKPADKKANDMISEIQQILDNITNTESAAKKKAEYNSFVETADNQFKNGNWTAAKESYQSALNIIPKDAYATEQMKKATANEKGKSEAEAKYSKLISDGDASFNAGDYPKAKEIYTKAVAQKGEDDYPKSQLQKIEDILNPKVVQTGPLANMGTPNDNSIMEGQALLARAEAQRKNKSAIELQEENKDQQNLQGKRSEEKQLSSYEISAGVQEIEKQRTLNAPSDDESRLNTVSTVVDQSKKVISAVHKETNFESAETNDITNRMETERKEASKNYAVREGVYEKNTSVVKESSKSLENDLNNKQTKVYESSLETQKTVNNAVIKVAENDFEDYESRKVTEDDVRNAQKTVLQIDGERQIAAVDKSQSIKDEVEKNNTLKIEQDAEEAKLAAENKEILKVEERKINDNNFKAETENTQSTYETTTRLDNEKTELSKTNLRRDDNRLADVEAIKKGSSVLEEAYRNDFNNLYVKSLTNQGNIATEKRRDDGVVEMRAEAQKKDFASITVTDKGVVVKNTETVQSDENQRLSTRATIATEDIKIAKTSAVNSEKPNENKEILKKSEASNNALDKTAQEKQVQKNYDARKLIEKIDSKEIKYDEAAANALGNSYPEGVSQESFSENGTDGLPVAVITRRIVVTKGHGNIYVRKQTMSGLTYSKNGEPSTEYIWQKETADGRLVRNY